MYQGSRTGADEEVSQINLIEQFVKRDVARVAAAYAAVSWLFLQILDVVSSILPLPAWIGLFSIITLAIGFPITLIIAWMYRLTPEGRVEREETVPSHATAKIGGRKIDFVIIGALSLVIVMLLVQRSIESPELAGPDHPVISEYRKLTESNVMLPPVTSIFPLVTDDTRVYFTDFSDGDYAIREVLRTGGEAVRFEVPPRDYEFAAIPTSVAPDGKSLLLTVYDFTIPEWREDSLWTAPLVGAGLRRIGEGRMGVYSPDGSKIAFLKENERLFVANADMSEPVQVATLPGRAYAPSFSPDGSRIRLTVFKDAYAADLWEVRLEDGEPRQVLSEWQKDSLCCGSWTPDGEYYVFEARQGIRSQVWAVKDVEGAEPFQLTKGAIDFVRPTVSNDGMTVFASGWQLRGEVMEFDPEDRSFTPVDGLEGMSVDQVDFSADERWIAYVKYPEFSLWRKSVKGNDALQLTFYPMVAAEPRWSPDGRTIAFTGWIPGEPHRIYTVPADGGELELLSNQEVPSRSPSWSPDGRRLMFSEAGENRPRIRDLLTGETQTLAGTGSLYGPSWSPDGQLVAGYSGPDFVLHDMQSGEGRALAEGKMYERWYWSKDSTSILVIDNYVMGSKRSVYEIRVVDSTATKIWQIGQEIGAWGSDGRWFGVKPDGKLMMLRNHSIHNIYALEWSPN